MTSMFKIFPNIYSYRKYDWISLCGFFKSSQTNSMKNSVPYYHFVELWSKHYYLTQLKFFLRSSSIPFFSNDILVYFQITTCFYFCRFAWLRCYIYYGMADCCTLCFCLFNRYDALLQSGKNWKELCER